MPREVDIHQEDKPSRHWANGGEIAGMSAGEREEELDRFMDSVTNKVVVEEAKAAWTRKM